MKKEDFRFKEYILLETDSDHVEIQHIEDDGNDGLDINLTVYTDEFLRQYANETELLMGALELGLRRDGQIVRFTTQVIQMLNEVCTSAFYGNAECDLEETSDFHEDSAHIKIPEMIADLASRYAKENEIECIREDLEFELEFGDDE
jgi:hypothetical protein